jgi:hypothetical protein
MSHKPFSGHKIENATPEMMREELDKYFAHVQQHDPKTLEFALMVTGHSEANGSTHVCSMVGGPPPIIARIIAELMDELINREPAFAAFFLINFLQRMHGHPTANVEDAEAQVKNLLDKLRNNMPPNGGIH